MAGVAEWIAALSALTSAEVPRRALDLSHPDIAWIVAENSRKKRLSRLL